MKPYFLIFPMICDDQEFLKLKEIATALSSMNFNKICASGSSKQNIIYYLAKAIITIQDVVKSKNCQAYRFTSYALNLSVLKLQFVVEMMIKENPKAFSDEITILQTSILYISQLLEKTHSDYKAEIFTIG